MSKPISRKDTNGANASLQWESTAPVSALPGWYGDLLAAVSRHVSTGRRRALVAVNSELVLTYWHVGREILARQDAEGWGTKVIDRLSADLRAAFPDAKGFSPRNLKYMRAFADAWQEGPIVQPLAAQFELAPSPGPARPGAEPTTPVLVRLTRCRGRVE